MRAEPLLSERKHALQPDGFAVMTGIVLAAAVELQGFWHHVFKVLSRSGISKRTRGECLGQQIGFQTGDALGEQGS